MSKMISGCELSRLMGLPSYFMKNNYYRKTLIGVRMRKDRAYFNIPMAKCLARKFAHKSPVSLAEILARIDHYDP